MIPIELFGQEVDTDKLLSIFSIEAKRIFIAMAEKIGKDDFPGIQDAINVFITKQLTANAFSEGVYGYNPQKPSGEAYRDHLRDVLCNIENLAMIIVLMDRSGGFDSDAGRAYIVNALSVAEFPSESADLNIPNPLTES